MSTTVGNIEVMVKTRSGAIYCSKEMLSKIHFIQSDFNYNCQMIHAILERHHESSWVQIHPAAARRVLKSHSYDIGTEDFKEWHDFQEDILEMTSNNDWLLR